MIARCCPICTNAGTRTQIIIGFGYMIVPCEACKYRKALEQIATTYPYQVHSAVTIAAEALK